MSDDKDKIIMLLPTDDGKWVVANAVIEDKNIESLDDCIFELAEQDGVRPKMKFPVVLVRDVKKLRLKLIEDLIDRFKYECETCGQAVILDDEIKKIINKRFGCDKDD